MTIYAYWTRGDEFAAMARKSAESVKRVDPAGRIEFITDDGSRPAMVANLDAQLKVLGWADRGERVLFLDADTLMLKPFPWDLQADLYVTWRDQVNGDREMAIHQPYNYGVVGCIVRPQTIEAFMWMRARILQMGRKNQDWYGNQLAMAELIGLPNAERKDVRIRWALADAGTPLAVRCLPCETWNYSPDTEGEEIKDKGIIHLKGDRKDLMQHYAERIAA
jgi:hypothetical protein